MDNSWLENIAQDESLWIENISEWPSIVAYEYKNLRDLCSNGKAYGALMCLKDNFETILKFETLLAFAWAEKNTDESFKKETISKITTRDLSMGSWRKLAELIYSDLSDINMNLPADIPLEALSERYVDLGIVNWRNTKVGHGALELEDDEDFREDLRETIIDLKDILELIKDDIKNQKLYSDGICLEGPELARGLDVTGEITCILTGSNIEFSVDPYILIRKHEKRGYGVYFFDNQKTKTLSIFQSYADGSRATEANFYFEQLRRYLGQTSIDLMANPDDEFLDETESKELDALQMSHSFVRPDHLLNWLKNCVHKHDRGIFLLQMERGMGKSVFSDKLDRLYKDPLVIEEDIDVRTYHFSRSQSAASEDIRQRIEWQWANEYQGKSSWQREPRISDFEREGMTTAEALCAFLDAVEHYTKRNRRHRKRIMMVLDGLDEIIQEQIWEVFPKSNMLPEGVYILLTSRNEQEEGIPELLKGLGERLSVNEHQVITRRQEENKSFLRTYIKNTGLRKITESQACLLMEKSDYLVLYLGMLCKLAEYGIAINDLPDAGKVIEVYMSAVNECYGDKESIRIREILAVLATLGMLEPLTLAEIGGYTAEGSVTLGLIGMIRDLSPMLKTIRSENGNRYTIANPDLAAELRKQLPETEDVITELINIGKDQVRSGYPADLKEAEPVIAHIAELESLSAGSVKLDESFIMVLSEFANDAYSEAQYIKERDRSIDYKKQLYLLCRDRYSDANINTLLAKQDLALAIMNFKSDDTAVVIQKDVAISHALLLGEDHPGTLIAYRNLADMYSRVNKNSEALGIIEHVYKKQKAILSEDDREILVTMNSLALVMNRLGMYEDAIKIQMDVVKAIENSKDVDYKGLIAAKSNLAIALRDNYRFEEAIKLQKETLDAIQNILPEDHPDVIHYMAELSKTFFTIRKFEEAKELQEDVANYSEKVLGKDHPETLLYLSDLGRTYRMLGELEKAESIQEEALERSQRVLGDEHTTTMQALGELGGIYKAERKFNEALKILKRGRSISESIYGKDHPQTAISIDNIASIYSDKGDYDKAIELRKKALDIFRRTIGIERSETINAIQLLSDLYEIKGWHSKARILREEALEISKRVLGKENRMTIIIMNRLSVTYFALGIYDDSIKMMEDAVNLSKLHLGPNHPDTLNCIEALSILKKALNQKKQSKNLLN